MLKNGYIKLHRSILDWEWYDDPKTKTVFLHLLLTANIADVQWHGITVKRGERVSSFRKLADETNLSIKEVRTAINHLKRTQEVAHLPHGEFSVFSIKNYEKFQGWAQPEAQEGHTEGTGRAQEGQQYKKKKKNLEEKQEKAPVGQLSSFGCPCPPGMTMEEFEDYYREMTE